MGSTANALLDEFELGPDGEFEIILSAEPHEGNWLPLDEGATMLVVRHFFYDWEHEVPVTMSIEALSGPADLEEHTPVEPKAAMARQVIALGDFLEENLNFFLGLLQSRGAQHLPAPLGRDGHGRRRREPPGDRFVEAGTRRGTDHRGRAARGPVLELLAREHLVGDHRLRQSPVEPQRVPGCGGRRRQGPGGGGPSRTRAWPTGWTPPGTARGRSSCGASVPKPPRCRPPGWCPSTGWPRSCHRASDGCRPSERAAAIDIRRRAVSRRFAR